MGSDPNVQVDKLVGKSLGKCLLRKKIGKGGMGDVYLAEHQLLQKYVAVKVLPTDFTRNPEFVARFHREAVAAARLEHPNIVQVHDIGGGEDENPYYYIVMSYVEGKSLQELLDESNGPLEPKEAARIALETAKGLGFAHRHGIVHRDIKPANILIGNAGEVKLTDFGLAFDVDSGTQLTRAGAIMGTPHFISPEQADGKRADERSDLYSLGVVLYYMATGVKPFVGESTMAILFKHVNQEPEPPSKLNPKIPQRMNKIIGRLLEKKPDERYQIADELVKDLDDYLRNADKPAVAPAQKRPTGHQPAVARKSSGTLRVKDYADPSVQSGARKGRPMTEPKISKRLGLVPLLAVASGIIVIGGIILLLILSKGEKKTSNGEDTTPVVQEDQYTETLRRAMEAETKNQYEDAKALFERAARLKDTEAARAGIQRCKDKILEQIEEEVWKAAVEGNSIASYDTYLKKYPAGRHAEEARKKKQQLEQGQPWVKESDFEGIFLAATDLAAYLPCGHLRPYALAQGDVLGVEYPLDGPGPETEAHVFFHTRIEMADYVVRGEVYLETGKLGIVARHPTPEYTEPGHGQFLLLPLDEAPRFQWVTVQLRVKEDRAYLKIGDGKESDRYIVSTISRFGGSGFAVYRGTKVKFRRIRFRVESRVDLAEVKKRMAEATLAAREKQELLRVQTCFGQLEQAQLLGRKPGPVREKLEGIRKELTTDAAKKEMDALLARVLAVDAVLRGFLDECREHLNKELELKTSKGPRKGLVKEVGEEAVTIGTQSVPLVEVLAVALVEMAGTRASKVQQMHFLLVEGEGMAALDRVLKGTEFAPEAAPFVDEIVDAAVAEALRKLKDRKGKDAEAILQRLKPLTLSAANQEKVKGIQEELSRERLELARAAALELVKKGKIREGKEELLKIVKDPDGGAVGEEAAKDLYRIVMNEPWKEVKEAKDWVVDAAVRPSVRFDPGEVVINADSAHLAPAGMEGAKGFAAEINIDVFRNQEGAGIAWAHKDKDNLRKAVLTADSILVILVEGGRPRLLTSKRLEKSPVGSWMRIAAFEVGDSLLVYLNGSLVARLDAGPGLFTAKSGIVVAGAAARVRDAKKR